VFANDLRLKWCSLNFPQIAIGRHLWETVSMATKQFVPGAGDLVTSRYKRGVFKVLAISHGGQTAAIQLFDISKQQLGGKPMEDIPCDTLLPYHDLTPLP
jgi:hypothetical protein